MADSTLLVARAHEPATCTAVDLATLLAAPDRDAEALADRLHDGALQALVAARYTADAACRGGDAALARDAVQEALVALRRAVWDLRPRGGDDLPAALAELAQRRAEAGAGALELDVDGPACARLTGVARAAAYRFVQAASPVDGPAAVRVTRDGGCVAVVAGGAPADVAAWTARAGALGGRLDTSEPAVRLLLPIDPAHDPDPKDAR